MSPRNQDDTNCKSAHFQRDADNSINLDYTPNILHKKHKVIKLVKAQLLNLQEDGLQDSFSSTATGNEYSVRRGVDFSLDVDNEETAEQNARMSAHPGYERSGMVYNSNEPMSPLLWFAWITLLLITLFIMLLLAAWLSAGPLSTRAPHTPIPWSSILKTDGICELERKYLLRWSGSNYLE